MPAVGIALIRRKHKLAAVRAHGHMLHFEIAGRQFHRGAALRGNGIQMHPAALLPGEDNATVHPKQLSWRHDGLKTAAAARLRAPDLPAVPAAYFGRTARPRFFRTNLRSKCK